MPRRHRPPSRIPAFLAVPLRGRSDGWTALRQAEFIGFLAESGSVRTAARMVGMTREGAYRLRARAGANGFAAAWDIALGRAVEQGDTSDTPAWKVTHDELVRRASEGVWRVVLRDGRYCGSVLSPDNNALLRIIARMRRGDTSGAGYAPLPVPGADKTSIERQPRRGHASRIQPSLTSPSSSPSQ